MRKENVFLFIILLPIAIQAYDSEKHFFFDSLFKLHNDERKLRQLEILKFDKDLSSSAMKLASKIVSKTINECEKDKGINEFWHNKNDPPLTPEMVHNDWLSEEVDIIENEESTVCPAKIIWKDTTSIGFGYATLNDETVYVALYQPFNENC